MALDPVISSSVRVPGAYLKVSLGVGQRSTADQPWRTLMLGNKLAAGTAAVNTPVAVVSEDDAITKFGAGSELHRMVKKFFEINPTGVLDCAAVFESAGAQTSLNVVFTGTATAPGTFYVRVADDEVIPISVAVGDPADTIGEAIEAAVNAQSGGPATVQNTSGNVVFTAKQKGPRGNFIKVWTSGSVVGITHTNVDSYLSGGTTSDDPQTALDASMAKRYHCVIAPHSDSTNLAKYESFVDANAGPLEGRRGAFLAATLASQGAAVTLATGINEKRGRIVSHYNAHTPAAEVAAMAGAVYALKSGDDRAYNYDGEVIPGLEAQRNVADWPTFQEVNAALLGGVTPLGVTVTGEVFFTRFVTTYTLDSGGGTDYRVTDVHYTDVPDIIADQIQDNFFEAFGGSKLADDDEEKAPPPGVATPKTIKDWLGTQLKLFDATPGVDGGGESGNYLVNVATSVANMVVELDADVKGRVNASIPLDVVELLHQLGADVRQIA